MEIVLKKICDDKEIRISEVVKKSGVPQSTLSKFINGQSSLTLEQIDSVLEVVHIELSEYDYFLNNFRHNYQEEYFLKIEQANLIGDKRTLQDIYLEAEKYNERLLALSAKACLGKLTDDEIIEISSNFIGIKIFSIFELYILSSTISCLSPHMIIGIIRDLKKYHNQMNHRKKYRDILMLISCRASWTCIMQDFQKESFEILEYAKDMCCERDTYSQLTYRFVQSYYQVIYGEDKEHAKGLDDMEKVISIFEWTNSISLVSYYKNIYNEAVDNIRKISWLKYIIEEKS